MGILQILQLIMALPGLIKMIMEIIDALNGEKDPVKKAQAEAELDAIKFEVMRKKRVGSREKRRLEELRDQLRQKR